ncbi:hypothetical protein HWV62_38516 [Athelia sp. TMB]|nr:hypothetical protein HWV62_38516 [Athelia sp. TMB]
MLLVFSAHSILDAWKGDAITEEKKVNFLYVDEVQDNLLIDAKSMSNRPNYWRFASESAVVVLRMLCKNPNGLFWAGDTAQAISVGSSFRFDDLKSFLFRVERTLPSKKGAIKVPPPTSFQLVTNYRSHGGIVRCARSIVEMITAFWPSAIDNLAPEEGVVNGPKPTFFYGWGAENTGHSQFFAQLKAPEQSEIEFGAEQCILVRDHEQRLKLRKELGNVGTIMTLYDSKGLEFNDVLLYNFFQDSSAEFSKWRVVLNMMVSGEFPYSLPQFDDARHASICSEMLWMKNGLIATCVPGDHVPQLATRSTKEAWSKKGRSFFINKRYLYAMEAYQKAGEDHNALIANAYYLRDEAQRTPIKSGPRGDAASKSAFLNAANAFLACAAQAPAATIKYFKSAADCFVKSGDDSRAADTYLKAGEYEVAAKLYRNVGRFEDAVNTIQQHPQRINAAVADSIMDVTRLVYLRDPESKHLTSACKATLFSKPQDAIQFASDYELDVARAMLLLKEGKPAEAAEIHLSEGRTEQAIGILMTHLKDRVCTERAAQFAVRALWRHISFGVPVADVIGDPLLGQWRHLAEKLACVSTITERHLDEVKMFQALITHRSQDLRRLGLKFNEENNKAAALLCLDHFHSTSPPICEANTVEEGIAILEPFLVYAELLHDAARIEDPSKSRTAQKLFAFMPSEEDLFTITGGTFLDRLKAPFSEENDKRTLLSKDLSVALKSGLSERLKVKVMEMHYLCRKAKIFLPCLNYLLGTCKTVDCPRGHFGPAALTPRWYNDRVRLHMLQIQIFQQLHFIDIKRELGERTYLLRRYYEALNPCVYYLGSRANLDLERTPAVQWARRVVNDWVKESIYTSNPHHSPVFIDIFSRAVALNFENEGDQAISYIWKVMTM